jgi:hypothetical protein
MRRSLKDNLSYRESIESNQIYGATSKDLDFLHASSEIYCKVWERIHFQVLEQILEITYSIEDQIKFHGCSHFHKIS